MEEKEKEDGNWTKAKVHSKPLDESDGEWQTPKSITTNKSIPDKSLEFQPIKVYNPKGFIPHCTAFNSLNPNQIDRITNLCRETNFYNTNSQEFNLDAFPDHQKEPESNLKLDKNVLENSKINIETEKKKEIKELITTDSKEILNELLNLMIEKNNNLNPDKEKEFNQEKKIEEIFNEELNKKEDDNDDNYNLDSKKQEIPIVSVSNAQIDEYEILKEKIVIEREELKRVIEEIKIMHQDQQFTINSLGQYVGANLSNAYSKGSSISLNALEKLEIMANRKIQHIIVLDNKSTKRIILDKSKELAELIGFILVSGSINIYTSKNGKSKSYSLYIHFRKRNRFEILINHIKSLIINLFEIDESKIEIIKNDANEIMAFRIYSLPIFYELFIHGVKIDDKKVPNWIFDTDEFIVHCLKGLFNGYGDFSLSLPEYKDSVYGNFSLIFEKGSPSSVELAKEFKKMCDNLEIETSKIYTRQASKEDPTLRVIVHINKKESYIRFLELVNPLIWSIKKESIYEFYSKAGVNPETIFKYSEEYLLQQEFNYSKELAEHLLNLFEVYGNYDDITEVFNKFLIKGKTRSLGKDRIISYIKSLFEESEYIRCYGIEGYERWYNNNSRILIGDDLESTTIPHYLNIQIFREIYQVLSNNLFDITDSEVTKSVSDCFIHKKMIKFSNVNEPNLLEYGRFSNLLKSPQSKDLFELYFNYIIKFIRKINYQTEKDRRISYTELANKYNILFYHHQHVKQIIEDLEAEFSETFKVGFDQDYRWHRLRFKSHPTNLMKIKDITLFKNLNAYFDKISKMDYDVDIFRIENPRCSDFYIAGSRLKPIPSKILLPYINKLHDKGIIKINNETSLGTRLIKYANLAEQYYKVKYPQKSYNEFLSEEENIYHDQLQNFIFMNDSDIIGTEILVWLKINFPLMNIDFLSGHIDFLFFYDNCLYVCDYKPEKRDRIFLKSIPQISVYGLLLEAILKISNLKIKCITFNKTNAWEYEPNILFMHIKDIIKELKAEYPISAKWELFLNQHFNFN